MALYNLNQNQNPFQSYQQHGPPGQFQNQNQNQQFPNQFQDQRQQNSTPCPIAIGPVQENDIEAVLKQVQVKLYSYLINVNLSQLERFYSCHQSYQYVTVVFPNADDCKTLYIRTRNIIYFRNEPIMISPSAHPIDELYIRFVDSLFPHCITGTFLDLSDIKLKSQPLDGDENSGIDISRIPSALPFLLFLCSLKCRVLLREIEVISFNNNFMNRYINMAYFAKFFPALKKISLDVPKHMYAENQNLKSDFEQEIRKLEKIGVTIDTDRRISHAEFDDPKKFIDYFGHPGFRKPVPPKMEALPLPNVAVPQIAREDEKKPDEIRLNKYDFPTNSFIQQFIRDNRESVASTVKYYSQTAVFSLTVDSCPANSPMAHYAQFSANRLKSDQTPAVIGPQEIAQAMFQVFGEKFDAVLTNVNQAEVLKNVYAIVLHGGFKNFENGYYAFDRSLMATLIDDDFIVFNDHIFVRNAAYI